MWVNQKLNDYLPNIKSSSNIAIKSLISNPSSTPVQSGRTIAVADEQNKTLIGGMNVVGYPDGRYANRLFIMNDLRNNNPQAAITITVDENGNIFTNAPDPVSSSNTNNIATTYWVNQKLNDYLPKTGGTVVGNLGLKGQISNYSVIPSNTQQNRITWYDYTNNKTIGGIYGQAGADGSFGTYMYIANGLRNNNNANWLGITVLNDGTVATTAPTPPTAANDSRIANTYWVREQAKQKTDGIVLKSYAKNTDDFYYEFTNGLIIQGGIASASSAGNNTVTLLKSYTHWSSYTVTISSFNNTSNDVVNLYERSTTYFRFYTPTASRKISWIAIGAN